MFQNDLAEAAAMLVEEIEAWEKPEDGNVMASLAPADDQDADFLVTIFYYPVSWRGHEDGEKVGTRPLFSIGEDDWDEESKRKVREGFRESLEAITKQWRVTMMQRIQETL